LDVSVFVILAISIINIYTTRKTIRNVLTFILVLGWKIIFWIAFLNRISLKHL